MNEDERGITPANETTITVEPGNGESLVTIERGNGDVIHRFGLTPMERVQLVAILGGVWDAVSINASHVSFVDVTRTEVAQLMHLADKYAPDKNGYLITACTNVEPRSRWTVNAADVTCGNCLRTHAYTRLTKEDKGR